jgi:hypothetical protein
MEKTVSLDQINFYKSIGYSCLRYVPNKGLCGLHEFLFTIGIVYGLDSTGYKGRYCYPKENLVDAVVALADWSGEGGPKGNWVAHK